MPGQSREIFLCLNNCHTLSLSGSSLYPSQEMRDSFSPHSSHGPYLVCDIKVTELQPAVLIKMVCAIGGGGVVCVSGGCSVARARFKCSDTVGFSQLLCRSSERGKVWPPLGDYSLSERRAEEEGRWYMLFKVQLGSLQQKYPPLPFVQSVHHGVLSPCLYSGSVLSLLQLSCSSSELQSGTE